MLKRILIYTVGLIGIIGTPALQADSSFGSSFGGSILGSFVGSAIGNAVTQPRCHRERVYVERPCGPTHVHHVHPQRVVYVEPQPCVEVKYTPSVEYVYEQPTRTKVVKVKDHQSRQKDLEESKARELNAQARYEETHARLLKEEARRLEAEAELKRVKAQKIEVELAAAKK